MSQPTIVALNGSPHKGMGNTSEMLAMLRTHLEALGAQMEEVFLCRKEIQYCVGCAVCLEKGQCWIRDDHAEIVQRVLKADAVVLASPVYFEHVTAQMKAFLDRSLAYGHKPQPSWKPGLAVTVSAGMGETAVADYLGGVMRAFGAYPVGSLTAIAVGPGDFVGHDAVDACAADLAEDLMRAVRGGRRPPATDRDLRFWQFMGSLVRENQEIMADDFAHWQRHNLWEGFERYVGQERSRPAVEPALRRAWVRETIARSNRADAEHPPANAAVESSLPATCREALAAMPSSLDPRAAQRVEAVYEFHVQDEGIVAHLRVSGGACSFAEEPAERPDLVIHTPGAVWLAIARGELDGQQAYLTGQYRAEGDLACLVKLPILFPRPPSGEEVRERAVARL